MFSPYKSKGGFFTTNKLNFKIDDNKNNINDNNNDIDIDNNESNESSERQSYEKGGTKNRVILINKIPSKANKIRNFEGFKNKKEKKFFNNLNKKEIKIEKKEEEKEKDKVEIEQKGVGTLDFDIDKFKIGEPSINTGGISRLAQELFINDDNKKVINYNTVKEKEPFNPNRNNIDLDGITHLVNDVQTKDKLAKKKGNKYFKIYSIKKRKTKRKKKINKTKSSEKEEEKEEEEIPKIDFDLIKSTEPIQKPEEIKKEEPKKEIKNKFDYERYKKEKRKEMELDKKSNSKLLEILKSKEINRNTTKKKSILNEIYYSSNYKNEDSEEDDYVKKFQKIKKIEEKKYDNEDEEEDIITQMKKLKEAEKEKEGSESSSSSSSNSDDEDFDELDMSKDIENKGDIMKKNWIDNSPKFKNRIIDYNNKRRYAISNESHEMFNDLIKNEKNESLNDKMKKLYDKIEKKKRNKEMKKRKKYRPFSFAGVDLSSVEEIEKKKKMYLNRIKEDIKYKITEGKYHMIELDNFKNFEEAMIKFKLKSASDYKKVKIYVNLVEKYLNFYQNELDMKEKEKMDEDRINKFLRNLKQEILVTLPYVKKVKGRNCHSVDYFKEFQELSEYHGF